MVSSLNSHQDIPDEHHVARYCSPIKFDGGRIMARAFKLRKDEGYLSTNWMEYFNTNDVHWQIKCVRSAMLGTGYKLKPNGRFARLSVAKVKNSKYDLQVKHIPEPRNPSHAGICGIGKDENGSIALELAHSIRPCDIFPAVSED